MKKVRVPIYGQMSNLPHAWIVTNNRRSDLSNDRGRKKIYPNNKIYLEDGQEFELELMNPLMNSVLAIISINGQKISNSGLVLRPGERVYLDCFLESRKKFTFNTYQTEDSPEAQKAIQNNGYVQVAFHSEVVHHYTTFYNGSGTITINGIDNPYLGTTTIGGAGLFSGNSGNNNMFANLTSGTSNYTTNLSSSQNPQGLFDSQRSKSSSSNKLNDKLETGRVEGGSQSNQVFESVDMNFQSWAVSSITY